jgi:hypothetical protein
MPILIPTSSLKVLLMDNKLQNTKSKNRITLTKGIIAATIFKAYQEHNMVHVHVHVVFVFVFVFVFVYR